MQEKLAETDRMTVDEFLAFTEARPDGEIWELIEGIAVMRPSPTEWHQTSCKNILYWLEHHKRKNHATWSPMPGVGTRVPVSPKSLPRPDVFVKSARPADTHITDDALVIVDVLSRSNRPKDRAWRRRVYGSVPNCQHYVTVFMKSVEVVRHDRLDGWHGETIKGLDSVLRLGALGVTMPMREIYDSVPIE